MTISQIDPRSSQHETPEKHEPSTEPIWPAYVLILVALIITGMWCGFLGWEGYQILTWIAGSDT